uniref:Nicotinamide-nucleotide adenylyltransferase n=1 Tax=Hirondellea gigas TaxID=1518452 RepID=A0A6A7G731_9CRUS
MIRGGLVFATHHHHHHHHRQHIISCLFLRRMTTKTYDLNKNTHAVAVGMPMGSSPIHDELAELDEKTILNALPLNKLQKPSTGKPPLVLILCGAFSPITNMHLRLFEEARNYLMYDQHRYDVIGGFISPVNNEYPKESLVSGEHRLEMCRRAVETSSWINVAPWEVEQSRWVRTAVVLSKYHNLLNDNRDHNQPIHVKLLCGADFMKSFLTPNLWRPDHLEAILGRFGLSCIERPIGLLSPHQFIHDHDCLWEHRNNIDIIPPSVENNVSSSAIRRLCNRGQSIKFLVPDSVLSYIEQHKLYDREKKVKES